MGHMQSEESIIKLELSLKRLQKFDPNRALCCRWELRYQYSGIDAAFYFLFFIMSWC